LTFLVNCEALASISSSLKTVCIKTVRIGLNCVLIRAPFVQENTVFLASSTVRPIPKSVTRNTLMREQAGAAFEGAWAMGQTMSVEDVVKLALND